MSISLITEIQIPELNDSVSVVPLGAFSYNLRMQWLQRAGYWALSLTDADGNQLVSGVPVSQNSPLLLPIRSPMLPRGDIFAVTGSDSDDIGYSSFWNGTATLTYIEVD